MNISVQKLLAKMEQELVQAKSSQGEEHLRERVYSIKTLCELILEEKQLQQTSSSAFYQPPIGQVPVQQPAVLTPGPQQVPSQPVIQPKRVEMEDDANGESLFDF